MNWSVVFCIQEGQGKTPGHRNCGNLGTTNRMSGIQAGLIRGMCGRLIHEQQACNTQCMRIAGSPMACTGRPGGQEGPVGSLPCCRYCSVSVGDRAVQHPTSKMSIFKIDRLSVRQKNTQPSAFPKAPVVCSESKNVMLLSFLF